MRLRQEVQALPRRTEGVTLTLTAPDSGIRTSTDGGNWGNASRSSQRASSQITRSRIFAEHNSLWSTDLFRCESILLRSHWVLVVMDLFTRRIIGFGVEPANVDGVSVCRMFNHAIADRRLPKHLSTDHDTLFRFHRWLANLRVLDIEEIKSIPYAPVSHPFVERLIGTIRREYLDRVLFYNSLDLRRKLEAFRTYYNGSRVHQSLGGGTPEEHSGKPPPARAALDSYGWRQHCHGLFQTPIAA